MIARAIALAFLAVATRLAAQPRAAVVHGDSGSVAVWSENDSTWVYITRPHGNAAISVNALDVPRVVDSAARAVGIQPDSVRVLRDPPPLTETFTAHKVDRYARQKPGNPRPQYPDQLRAKFEAGSIITQFIVDSIGRPVMGSFKVLVSDHRLFTLAVLAALPDLRFEPAQFEGRPVPELEQLKFVFGPLPGELSVRGIDGSPFKSSCRPRPSRETSPNTRGSFEKHASMGIDLSTVRILKSTHPLFALAVYQKIPSMRFEPARIGARPVKELVQQPYNFSLLR